MKKGTRNLIILGACAVALGAATALLSNGGGGTGASSSASSSSIQLVSKTSADVASMKVTNKKGSYTLVPLESKAASSAASSAASGSSSASAPAVTYTVQGLGGIPINTSETDSVVQNGFSLVATKNLGTVSNAEEFGLSDPQATVEVRFKDGTSFNYKIGNATATDSSAYYMSGADSSNVYVVTIDQGLLEDEKYFVNKEILSITPPASSSSSSSSETASNDFGRISLSGTSFPQTVVMEKQGDTLAITSPAAYPTDNTKLAAMESALTSLTADSVVAINPDASDLMKYGFDKPSVVADYNVNNGNYKLLVGAQSGSDYYVMLGGVNVVYSVASDSIGAVAQQNLFSMRSKLILLPEIGTVKSIEFSKGTASNIINIARTESASSAVSSASASSGSEKSYTYTVAGDGGKALNYDTNYKHFYQKLISLELLEDTGAKPSGTPAFTVKYSYFDKASTDTLEFYQAADRRYLAVVNGAPYGNVVSTDVDAVISQLADFEAGKAIPEPAG